VLAGLLDGQRFCGVACARTFILEALEMFDSSVAPSVLTEAEAMRIALRYLLTVMAVQGGPASQGRPS